MKIRKLIYHIILFPIFVFSFHQSFSQARQYATQPEAIPIDNNLTIYVGGGGNSGILVTDSAVIVIDTKMKIQAENLCNIAKEKAGGKKIIVINTHYHMDHTGGNKFYKGSKIYIGSYGKAYLEKYIDPENMPTDFVQKELTLNLGNETVQLVNLGQAHTYDDLIVYLENRKVLFAGDLVFHGINPVLKRESGANVDKWILALDTILRGWEINTVVPGHGSPGSKEILTEMKDYFIDMNVAALHPSKSDTLKSKYKNWVFTPDLTGPEKTIEYIREDK